MIKEKALILTNGLFIADNGKTAHGLVRASDRYHIVGVIDKELKHGDAGEILDGRHRNIPIFGTIQEALSFFAEKPSCLIIGVAVAGGKIPQDMKTILEDGICNGLNIINGLHEKLNDSRKFVQLAKKHNVKLIDIRRTKSPKEMSYWTGRIHQVKSPRLAVLGIDCAVGKRTTARMILESLRDENYNAHVVSTGQTGWMQDGKYGFVFDATINDFVTGELESEIVRCDQEQTPDIIIINGQSGLRNPIGPTGSEILLSGQTKHVILQVVPARKYYEGTEDNIKTKLPSIKSEIKLIKMYGAKTIAITINTHGLTLDEAKKLQKKYLKKLGIPVILPLEDGVSELVKVIRKKILNNNC